MSIRLAGSAGATAVILVAEFTVKLVAATDPNRTTVAPVNPVPVITTDVPPVCEPVAGATLVIVGGATYLYAATAPPALSPVPFVSLIVTFAAPCAGAT